MTLRLISADSHINEPPDLWTTRVPAKYRDRAPRIEHFDQGDAWVMEGALDPINFGGNCSAGLPVDQRSAWIRFEEVRPGGYLPAPRLAEQDADGVVAEALYPTPRISNQVFWHRADADFHLACIRAYNDWLAEFCSHAPERLWGMGLLPNVGVEAAVAEAERVRDLPGMRGFVIGRYPNGDDAPTDDDDAVWAVAAEAAMPVAIHVGFPDAPQGDKKRMKVTGDMRFFDAPIRAGQFVKSAIFDRFPELTLLLVEVDSSWLPYLMEQMDDRHLRAAPDSRPALERLPSEYFATNIASTFITDRYGIENRHHIGVTQMMWSSDFPHGGSDWPNSRAVVEEHFAAVPADERDLIVFTNAARIHAMAVDQLAT